MCGALRWASAMPVCVLFMSRMSGIIFNTCASAVTDYSQSEKDIDRYFKFQLCVGPWPMKIDTHFSEKKLE